jgi:hypothetical protein
MENENENENEVYVFVWNILNNEELKTAFI